MTISDFIQRLREDILDDNVEPYKWSDETLTRFANQAEAEACRRANLIIDSNTAVVCIINVRANTSTYPLHNSILSILSAYNETDKYPLFQTDKITLDLEYPTWKSEKSQTPKWFMIDDGDILTIIPTPAADFSLRLTVSRLPINTNKEESDEFEIPSQFQEGLLYYAAYLALSMKDINTERPKDALTHLAVFEQWFGKPKTAKSIINRKRRPVVPGMRAMAKKFGFP